MDISPMIIPIHDTSSLYFRYNLSFHWSINISSWPTPITHSK